MGGARGGLWQPRGGVHGPPSSATVPGAGLSDSAQLQLGQRGPHQPAALRDQGEETHRERGHCHLL